MQGFTAAQLKQIKAERNKGKLDAVLSDDHIRQLEEKEFYHGLRHAMDRFNKSGHHLYYESGRKFLPDEQFGCLEIDDHCCNYDHLCVVAEMSNISSLITGHGYPHKTFRYEFYPENEWRERHKELISMFGESVFIRHHDLSNVKFVDKDVMKKYKGIKQHETSIRFHFIKVSADASS